MPTQKQPFYKQSTTYSFSPSGRKEKASINHGFSTQNSQLRMNFYEFEGGAK
jgi:hypothetical protein